MAKITEWWCTAESSGNLEFPKTGTSYSAGALPNFLLCVVKVTTTMPPFLTIGSLSHAMGNDRMNISEINSIGNLESLGTVAELRQQLQEMVSPLKVVAENYDDLFNIILFLQKNWVDPNPSPFVNRKAEVIFYLTKLEGAVRNDLLGLTEEHFRNPVLAKKWYRSLSQLTHSDREGGSDEAFLALQKIYRIVSFAGDEDE